MWRCRSIPFATVVIICTVSLILLHHVAALTAQSESSPPRGVILKSDRSIPSSDSDLGSLAAWQPEWGKEDTTASFADRQLARLRQFSMKPLKGWNSCGAFMWSTTEDEMRANIDLTAEYLQPSGYNIIELDWYWNLDLNGITTYLDEYGRPQPDPNRWPNATGMQGFKKLTEYIHSKGMLFGLHVMRGISQVAIEYKLPVFGTNYTADQVYDPTRMCPWACKTGTYFYALKENHPASQAFYDSLYTQYASWGVDMIKADCYYGSYYLLDQIQAVSDAIDHSGRPMLLSLSAGNGPDASQVTQAAAVTPIANVYRMTDDTWADWQTWKIYNHWAAAYNIQPFLGGAKTGRYGLPAYPDYDNPPFGWLTDPYQGREPHFMSPLTRDETYTVAAFWMFSRAPMFYEGDLRTPDDFSLSLVTNKRAIQMMDYSINITAIQYTNLNQSVWKSISTLNNNNYYLALFNILNNNTQILNVNMNTVIVSSPPSTAVIQCNLQEIWNGTTITGVEVLTVTLPSHGSALYLVSGCTTVATNTTKLLQAE